MISAVLIWLIYPVFLGGFGWQPTPIDRVREMLSMADVKPGDTVYDLGSGDGRIIAVAAKEFGARAVGIEIDPVRVLLSRLRIRGLRDVAVVRGNFFKADLGDATVVTLFQRAGTNNALRDKFVSELKPGSRVVSFVYDIEGWTPSKVNEKARIYLYVIQ